MARAIKELLDNPVKKKLISENAKYSAEVFSENVIYMQWKKYLEKVIKNNLG